MNGTAFVRAICLSAEKGTVKEVVGRAELRADHGLVGDAHAGPWHRQVSLLAQADIEEMKAKGLQDLQPGAFGENLVVDGLDPAALGLGSRLLIGDTAEVRITQKGKVCHSRCAIYHRTGDCIMPRNGVFARVLRGGAVSSGDPLQVLESVDPDRIQAVVLVAMEACSKEEEQEAGIGSEVARRLEEGLGAHIYAVESLSCREGMIDDRIRHYRKGHSIDLVVAVGGGEDSGRGVHPDGGGGILLELPHPFSAGTVAEALSAHLPSLASGLAARKRARGRHDAGLERPGRTSVEGPLG